MQRKTKWLETGTLAAIGLATTLAACNDNSITDNPPPISAYVQTKLVADASGTGATTTDPNLVNPWGLAFGGTGVLWVANNGTGTSTLYDANGTVHSLVVAIPSATGPSGGTPTGTIFNSTTSFAIPGGGASAFIFAGEDGTISAWGTGTAAVRVVDRSALNAVYKGIAMGTNAGANFLFATNFKNNSIDMFDANFLFVKSFTDPSIPAGFAPFGIQSINGKLYVTFAKQLGPDNHDDQPGVGNGYVDIFNTDGTLSSRFASTGSLNSPWGIAMAPSGFGTLSGDILIGNFGDGLIGAYNQSGAFIDFLRDTNGAPIAIDGLWSLTFGPAAQATTLFFSAGPGGETHGLVGTLTVH